MKRLISIEGVKKTLFGSGAVGSLPGELEALGAARALLVMDRALSETELGKRVQEVFAQGPVEAVPYFRISPEPGPELADEGAELARQERVDCIVGVGGGSSLDVAKAIGVLTKNEGKALDYVGLNLVKTPGLPTVMVPTTAGTGSETTFTAVFTMRGTKTKGGINSPFLYPTVAILDPELTLGLPPYPTAYTGMDALTHAIESYTSLQSHFVTDALSLEAVKIIAGSLRGAVFQGGNLHHRTRMLQASYLAGLGLAMSGVGAVHALAYPLGAFFDIPHGIANALMLPYVLDFNFPGNTEKFAAVAVAMGAVAKGRSERVLAAEAADRVWELSQDIGAPLRLRDLGVPEDSIPRMAEAAMNVTRPILNNPRPMTAAVAERIYRRAFEGR